MLRKVIIRDVQRSSWLVFDRPIDVLSAHTQSEVFTTLTKVEELVRAKALFAAGFVSYEAAPGLDPALSAKRDTRLPLLSFGLFGEPRRMWNLPDRSRECFASVDWQMSTSRGEYLVGFKEIKKQIELGNTYQVNYTLRQRADNIFDPWELFLNIAGDAACGAYLEADEFAVVSASPELFFSLNDLRLTCRPMKGTASRGMNLVNDRLSGRDLQSCGKNRAENVMIADMIRSDMGRIAVPGSVQAHSLFDVERHSTLWQMTSTITATTTSPISEIFRALFPCASVTGAPKVSSMSIIERLEDSPREIYSGSIGWVGPRRQAQFNVAIRTAWVDKRSHMGTYGVGGGIVWDSQPEQEYRECLLKAQVLTSRVRSSDFKLLETMLWAPDEGYFLLEHHLSRLQSSAKYFGFKIDLERVEAALSQLASHLSGNCYLVRLLLDQYGESQLTHSLLADDSSASPKIVKLSAEPIDTSDPFLYHKTTQRDVYSKALDSVGECDDVLLWNSDGFITETTVANVVALIEGEWFSPPVSCGLLNGTYREWLLQQGEIKERKIHIDDLNETEDLILINSVRGRKHARLAI